MNILANACIPSLGRRLQAARAIVPYWCSRSPARRAGVGVRRAAPPRHRPGPGHRLRVRRVRRAVAGPVARLSHQAGFLQAHAERRRARYGRSGVTSAIDDGLVMANIYKLLSCLFILFEYPIVNY